MTARNSNAQAAAQSCYHCGLPVPRGASYDVEIDGVSRPMCCPGCRAVAQAIVDGGLQDYYRHRTAMPDGRSALAIALERRDFESARLLVESDQVHTRSGIQHGPFQQGSARRLDHRQSLR